MITTFISNNHENKNRLIQTMKKSLTTAAAEFCVIDNRLFALLQGDGFQCLADAIYGAGRALGTLAPVGSILPNRTAVNLFLRSASSPVYFVFIFSDQP